MISLRSNPTHLGGKMFNKFLKNNHVIYLAISIFSVSCGAPESTLSDTQSIQELYSGELSYSLIAGDDQHVNAYCHGKFVGKKKLRDIMTQPICNGTPRFSDSKTCEPFMADINMWDRCMREKYFSHRESITKSPSQPQQRQRTIRKPCDNIDVTAPRGQEALDRCLLETAPIKIPDSHNTTVDKCSKIDLTQQDLNLLNNCSRGKYSNTCRVGKYSNIDYELVEFRIKRKFGLDCNCTWEGCSDDNGF